MDKSCTEYPARIEDSAFIPVFFGFFGDIRYEDMGENIFMRDSALTKRKATAQHFFITRKRDISAVHVLFFKYIFKGMLYLFIFTEKHYAAAFEYIKTDAV